MPTAPPDRPSRAPPSACWPWAPTAFCVLLAEGSVTDWSAVFLNDEAGASEALAAGGLTVFSLAMATGRLAGDRLAERLGPVAVVRCGRPAGRGRPGDGTRDRRARAPGSRGSP